MKTGMNTDDEIYAKIIKYIKKNLIYKIDIKPTDRFFYELEYDSLSYVTLVMDLESEFDITIDIDEITVGLDTPLDVLEFIKGKLTGE